MALKEEYAGRSRALAEESEAVRDARHASQEAVAERIAAVVPAAEASSSSSAAVAQGEAAVLGRAHRDEALPTTAELHLLGTERRHKEE